MFPAILLLACLVLAGAVIVLAVALQHLRDRLATELDTLRAELAAFETAVEAEGSRHGLAGARPAPPIDERDEQYVITRLGEEQEAQPAPTLEGSLFADVVLRESVVKAASWIYAVRRGLSPENRNRIRFEMRREVKRARKHRKAEEREAIREWRARRRAAVGEQTQEESAA